MKIIALIGSSDSGKTSTLNLVLQQLIGRGYQLNSYTQLGDLPEDFQATVSKNGVKIGIATVGYFNSTQQPEKAEIAVGCKTTMEYIGDLDRENCHVVICCFSSPNNKKQINPDISLLPVFNYKVVKSISTHENERLYLNQQDAITIVQLIKV